MGPKENAENDGIDPSEQEADVSEPSFPDAVEALVTSAFREHWATVAKKIEAGDHFIEQRSDIFFALDEGQRMQLAHSFYTLPRAIGFATLSDDAILDQLSAWLDTAVDIAENEHPSVIARLVQSEYVIVSLREYPTAFVAPYPGDALYDDIYELTVGGVSSGGQILLYKSTGEPFSDEEVKIAEPAIIEDVEMNAASDHERVTVSVYRHDEYAIIVYVDLVEEEEENADDDSDDGDDSDDPDDGDDGDDGDDSDDGDDGDDSDDGDDGDDSDDGDDGNDTDKLD